MTRDRHPLRRAGNRGAVVNAARALAALRDADSAVDALVTRLACGEATGSDPSARSDLACGLPVVGPAPARATGAHVLALYEDDAALVETLTALLAPAWRAGDAVVVVATPPHRAQLLASLGAAGVRPSARGPQRLWLLDAATVMASILVDGSPDRARFRKVVAPVLAAAGARGRRVHVYGEIVALLWDAGNVQAALELERLWNELVGSVALSLCCGYPAAVLGHAGPSVDAMCAEHTHLVTSG